MVQREGYYRYTHVQFSTLGRQEFSVWRDHNDCRDRGMKKRELHKEKTEEICGGSCFDIQHNTD